MKLRMVVTFLTVAVLTGTVLASPRPNIVLILADDLDADELGATDDPTAWPSYTGKAKLGIPGPARKDRGGGYADHMLTPHIDSLMSGGATLTRFYITSPVCTPSRYALMTGRFPSRSPGFLELFPPGSQATLSWDTPVTAEETSLPKALQQAGYKTGVVGKWHNFPKGKAINKQFVLNHNPTLADYQKHGAAEGIRASYETALAFLRNGLGWDYVDRINIGNTVFNLEWLVEGALDFIEQNKADPFFLYVALPVPHGQYTMNYCNVAALEPRATSGGLIDRLPDVMPSRASIYERLKRKGISPDNAMATYMDDAVGALLKKLETLGLRENTLVFFVGDNPSRGKNSVFEGAREPAFAVWPGRIQPGARISSLCASTDVAATLVEAAGGVLPADIAQDSRSFLPQLLGQPAPADWRTAVMLEIGNSKAVVTKRWKYIANRVPPEVEALMEDDAGHAASTGEPRKLFWSGLDHHSYGAEMDFPSYYDSDQLYDLDTDIYETTNLASDPERAAVLKEMKGQLRALQASLPHGFGEFKPVTVHVIPKAASNTKVKSKKKNKTAPVKSEKPGKSASSAAATTAQARAKGFDKKDNNRDGNVSFAELLAANPGKDQETVKARFDKWDTNHDGSLSREELINMGEK